MLLLASSSEEVAFRRMLDADGWPSLWVLLLLLIPSVKLRVVLVFRRGVETAEIRTALGDDRGEVDEDAEASSALFEESEGESGGEGLTLLLFVLGRLLGVRDLIEVIAEGVDATDVDELLVLVGGCCFWLPDLLTVTSKGTDSEMGSGPDREASSSAGCGFCNRAVKRRFVSSRSLCC